MRLFLALVVVVTFTVTVASAQVQKSSRRFVRSPQVKLAVQPALFVDSPTVDAAVVPVPVPVTVPLPVDESLPAAAIAAVPNVLPYPRYFPDYNDWNDWNVPIPRYWGGSPRWYGWGGPRRSYGMPRVVPRPVVQPQETAPQDNQDSVTVPEVAAAVEPVVSSDSNVDAAVVDSLN